MTNDQYQSLLRGPILVIAGPCVIESAEICLAVAGPMKAVCERLKLPYVFKASFDKANRSQAASFRGPGLDEGLRILARVRREVGVPVTTDVHLPGQAAPVAEVADLLQVPAFLCRQTDLLLACAATGRPVNVKKGQFMAPGSMAGVLHKLSPGRVILTERGTSFGHGDLVVDFRGLPILRDLGTPVCMDATHACQRPRTGETSTGGDRALIAALARAAVAVGVDALFLEVHPDPDRAPCDGPNMLPLTSLTGLLRTLLAVREAGSRPETA
jgi:2-dehydro-3-deoxyphosphooctonate aldolase (KDO 8-P synthase)